MEREYLQRRLYRQIKFSLKHIKRRAALKWLNLIPNCSYNHSVEANCHSLTLGDYKYLVTLREIGVGEELLVDYNKDKDLEQPKKEWDI